MNRRTVLKLGVGLGATAALGTVGRYLLLPPSRSAELAPADELAARLMDALPDAARERACVPYDSPWRQYWNRGVGGGGLPIDAGTLSWDVRQVLVDLFHAGLGAEGRVRMPNQWFVNWPGVHVMRLLACGDPRDGPWQIVLSGPHVNLRIGGASVEGAAFGGPQIYGDQRGNGSVGLPGNVYRDQLLVAQALIGSLTDGQRSVVRVERAPPQVRVGVQGRGGRFDGLAVGELPAARRAHVERFVDLVLSTWPDEDVAFARECLAANGGVDALHLADYDVDHEGGRRAGAGPSQIVRLEGPGAVLHYRGEPHLHAFVNIARDGERPLSLGEELGTLGGDLQDEPLRRWFEEALVARTDADLGVYPVDSCVGRLRAGVVRTGDVWVAESWMDHLVLADVKGGDLAPSAAAALTARGASPQRDRTYRLATTAYVADEEPAAHLGRVSDRRFAGRVRDALVDHAREGGFG